jgi:nucleotide-binding universal stress UspA family protein
VFEKLLVPTDGSDFSQTAALRALEVAHRTGAAVHVLFVQDTYPPLGIGPHNSAGVQGLMTAAHHAGLQGLDKICDRARASGIPVESSTAEHHDVAQAIVDAAHSTQATMIVMGSHGRGGLRKLVLGSVAAKVLILSTLPVLVIK